MNAIVQTARKYGQVKSSFGRAFTDLCVRVTVEAATRQLRQDEIGDLYEAWGEGSGFANKTENFAEGATVQARGILEIRSFLWHPRHRLREKLARQQRARRPTGHVSDRTAQEVETRAHLK
jgi:hypothetical protein